MVQCQVVHILGNGLDLTARFSELSRPEQNMIGQLVDTGTVQDIPDGV